ncbi:MAG: betaine/proline/choline family ABC transporter ATP-binding protein [Myxococcales bacterium]|nr:betaine/proline/choline family ABC transporter ATP-binding protein [Myxococcales bacterium]
MASADTEELAIEADGLFKIFGPQPERALDLLERGVGRDEVLLETGATVAVQNVTFRVSRGEIFVVMGLSGCGKSTLLRMINRLVEPTSGRVRIYGQDVTAMDHGGLVALRRRDVSMVFQSFALLPHLNVLDNAAFGLEVAGVAKRERRERARSALQIVGLGEVVGKQPEELSGGMQQRVGLARALAAEPTILLMDEAFSALDPLIRDDMQSDLLRLQRDRRLTVMFISHDIDEAMRIGDRIAIMNGGKIVQVGTPSALVQHPKNEYVASFFRKGEEA